MFLASLGISSEAGASMAKSKMRLAKYHEVILYSVLLSLMRGGASITSIQTATAKYIEKARKSYHLEYLEDTNISTAVATALHAWHHKRRYLNPTSGKPLPLAKTGTGSTLRSLILSETPQVDVQAVIEALSRLGFLSRTKLGKYLPKKRYATIEALDPVLAEHVCATLERLLSTVQHNTRTGRRGARYIERSAQVFDLPENLLPDFRSFANAQGEVFVGAINDWLESRRSRNRLANRTKSVRAGVHLYAFAEGLSN